MFTFPFAISLIPYGLVVVFFILMAIINVAYLVHYGATTAVSFVITFLFLAGGVFILFFTYQGLNDTDWGRTINLSIPFIGGVPTLQT